MKNLMNGALIAIAAGSLFAAGCKKKEEAPSSQPAAEPAKPSQPEATGPAATPPAEKMSKVDCGGVNECKGQGTCRQETHGCGGQNECKGKGVLAMTEDDCKAKGGTVVAHN